MKCKLPHWVGVKILESITRHNQNKRNLALPLSIRYVAETSPEKAGIGANDLNAKLASEVVVDKMIDKIAKIAPTDATAFYCPRKATKEGALELLRSSP